MAGKLPRGFKAEAERTSERIRRELGLTLHDRLDCHCLAIHLGVRVVPLREMARLGVPTEAVAYLLDPEAGFSAVTVWCGGACLLIHNDEHSPERTANDIVHELSHMLQKHPPLPAISLGGCRDWDDRYEEEANWLAGALLVPRDGAFVHIRRGGSLEDGAIRFGVSLDLFRWRVNATGVSKVLGLRRAS